MADVDVVVIGGGLAGLTAARSLITRDRSVLVLEARDRVGGRLESVRMREADAVLDLGGQYVGPTQHEIMSLLDELGVRTETTRDTGDHVVHLGSRLLRYAAEPKLSLLTMLDLGRTVRLIDSTARRIPPHAPWSAPSAAKLDAQTFAEWLRRKGFTPRGRALLAAVTRAIFAAEPSEVSALWALFYVASGGGFDPLTATTGGAQQDWIVGGAQQVAERLAARLPVRLGTPATAIDWSEHGVEVAAGGMTVRARRAVLAVPPPLAGRLMYRPALPPDRAHLTQRMPMGSVIKVHVVYERPFWREAGLSGQAAGDSLPVGMVFDNCQEPDGPGVLVGFVDGAHAAEASRLDPERRRAMVIRCLATYFGAQAEHPIGYVERDWSTEPFSAGCYGAFGVPGTLTRYGKALRDPVGPLHFAGTETATRWAGYMDGAIQSGRRAADEVDLALR
ncbi:monoamine oxidase [Herbihabitans rhizosphaerae]|uniref:Monoamine oxidase n=1 Tax=Herbihabitans rhizosphaerae TaxID=1872711 RepID=A0A4Q7KL05_9PSEU|nr:flavin monoamine oxidase family protein [Herbihabitans rhizosphaerae]RZS36894.1 monoamine oxidase [Herbihabitans rhizosphaerae]